MIDANVIGILIIKVLQTGFWEKFLRSLTEIWLIKNLSSILTKINSSPKVTIGSVISKFY